MIVPMKKMFMIVQKKDFVSSVEEMRALGVVHVEHNDVLKSDEITAIKDDIQLLEKVIRILENSRSAVEEPKESVECVFEWRDVKEIVIHQMKKIEQLSDNVLKRQGIINRMQKWGDFEPQDIVQLKEKGINISFCEIPVSQKIELKAGVIVEVLSRTGSINNCMVITRGDIKSDYEGIVLPAKSLSHENDSLEKELKNIKRAENELKAQIKCVPALKKKLSEKEEKLVLKEVIVGSKNVGELTLLRGYCPQDACSQIEAKAKEQQWGIHFEEPAEDDKVPTLLKNPKWINIIKPVFDIINVLPGYKEFDVSLVFLVFFALFVGMLVGDAGYGLLVLSIFAGLHVKIAKSKKDVPLAKFMLVYLLCGSAIVWGLLTGTIFGQKWISSTVKPIVPWLLDDKNLQLLCFFIGTIHLSIAHIWNITVKIPSLKALGDLGWLLIIWGMYGVAKLLVLDIPMSTLSIMFLIIGAVFVVFFTRPNKNILKA
ncbi:MAG: hypothetical protein KKD07_02665, partial [Candidatus Omnitrophica bacterium]|nr:hypothetical protein [Candidatus Omnitrophota bacterium]